MVAVGSFDSRIGMDESRMAVEMGWWWGGVWFGWIGKSASKRFEMAVRPMTNGMNSKISCHFVNASIPARSSWICSGCHASFLPLDQEMMRVPPGRMPWRPHQWWMQRGAMRCNEVQSMEGEQ